MTAIIRIVSEPFGVLPDGRVVERHVITNARGASVSVIDYGAIITSIVAPDVAGNLGEVTLGYGSLADYVTDTYFMGAVVGRYANRIAHGQFKLDGVPYALPKNDGKHHLHGGPDGFYRALWKSSVVFEDAIPTLEYCMTSHDGHAGYPGELTVKVLYRFDEHCRLTVSYEAVTTRPTIVNLTQHSYFNLAGQGSILDHELQLFADRYAPTDEASIPTGELLPVDGTPFDFRAPCTIGSRIAAQDAQLNFAGGYDHNYVINGPDGLLKKAATLYCPRTGRQLSVHSTEPGMQFYSGNSLSKNGAVVRGAQRFGYREGLCLEPQHYPDAPNRPAFPSTRLDPGQEFHSTTVFEFGVR